MVESFNNTLARRLFEEMNKTEFDTGKGSNMWNHNLKSITKDLNYHKNEFIKLKPSDAIKKDIIELGRSQQKVISDKDKDLFHPKGTIVFRLLGSDEYLDIKTLNIKRERRRATDPLWDANFYIVEMAYRPMNGYYYHIIKNYNTGEEYPETIIIGLYKLFLMNT